MWIEEISINSFGAFSNGCVKGLGPELTVLIGPNEAGKTTILEFVRSVFFGFRKKSPRNNIYESRSGNARSGWVTIRTPLHGRLRVERTEKSGLREGLLGIVDEQGNRVDVASMPVLRDGAERRLFQSFFAFDLDSMRQLDQDALRGKIVATALGSFQINPLDVMKKVDERLKELGRRSSRDEGSLEGIQSRIKEIDKRLKVLGEKPKRYDALKIELDTVNKGLVHCKAQIQSKQSLLHGLEENLRFEEEWKKLLSLDHEIARLEGVRNFPADGVLRLEQALERLREAREGILEEQKTLDHIQGRYESLNPDTILTEHQSAIRFLGREAQRLGGLPRELEKAQAACKRSNDAVDRAILDLGVGWTRENASSTETSIVLEQSIRSFMTSWRQCSENILGLKSRMAEALERRRREAEKLHQMQRDLKALEPNCRGHLPRESQRRLHQWKEISARVADLRERLGEKSQSVKRAIAHNEELNERLEELNSQPGTIVPAFPFWALVALLICSGIGLLLASRHVLEASSVLIPLGVILTAAVPVIIKWKVHGDRRRRSVLVREKDTLAKKLAQNTSDIAGIEKQRRVIIQEIESLKSEAADIAGQVLGDPDAGLAEILMAEKRSAAAEEPFRRRRALDDAIRLNLADAEIEESRRKDIEESLRSAEQAMATLKARWTNDLSGKGFDPALEPETAIELIQRLRDIKNNLQRIAQEQAILVEMTEEWNNFARQVELLASQLNRPMPSDVSPMDQVETWAGAEKESREILAEKQTLSEKRREHEVRLGVLSKKAEESQDRVAALMEAASVTDEEAFRERAELHDQYRVMAQEQRVLTNNLLSGLKSHAEAEMRSLLDTRDWDGDRILVAQLHAELNELGQASQELAGRKGRLEKEIETLEAEEESELLLAKKEEWVARLNAAATEWTDLKIAFSMLSETLKFYESERQPRVLEKTSELLRAITGGALSRVLVPLNEDSVIQVERADGSRIDENLLSRGTLEQVYLSLRLAHLETHSNGGFAVPILMDDILVNFDPERASRTAQVLAQFSAETGMQLLFFTCHPHVAGLFPPQIAVRELGLARSCEND
ncbi:MAG: AAA family ATPase [Desulfomonile tiedjei]|nr:AAA family ATPase [Desulfomonile tiedjei]